MPPRSIAAGWRSSARATSTPRAGRTRGTWRGIARGGKSRAVQGGGAFPSAPWGDGIRSVLFEPEAAPVATPIVEAPAGERAMLEPSLTKRDYTSVLPLIVNLLTTPMNAAALARALAVPSAQLKPWLDRAVKEGQILKSGRPAQDGPAAEPANQRSLFGS